MELHFQYFERVQAASNNMENEDDDEDEIYLRKLDAGLYTLQLIDYIVIEIASSTTNIPSIRQRVTQILNLRTSSTDAIKAIVRGKTTRMGTQFMTIVFSPPPSEYANNLGSTKKSNGVEHSAATDGPTNGNHEDPQKQYLFDILDKF